MNNPSLVRLGRSFLLWWDILFILVGHSFYFGGTFFLFWEKDDEHLTMVFQLG